MYIKFIKRHAVGIKEGVVVKVNPAFGDKMIADNYAEETTEESFNSFKAKHYGQEEKPKKKENKKSKKKVKS